MKKKQLYLALLVCFLMGVFVSCELGTGEDNTAFDASQARSVMVSQLNELPHKSHVVLTGNIVQFIGGEYYVFRDPTGDLIIEIDRKRWQGLSVGPSDRVEISGKLKKENGGRIEIDVKSIRKLSGNTGTSGTPGYTGPAGSYGQAVTVSQLNTIPSNSFVILTGNIIQPVGKKYYTFRDSAPSNEGGGEITIEIESKVWQGLTVGPSDRVEITVKVEKKKDGRIEVEAKNIRKL